jgi:hypothetical protein
MSDLIKAISETPVPTIFAFGGIIFMLIAFLRKAGKETEFEQHPKIRVLILGILLLVISLGLYVLPFFFSGNETISVVEAPNFPFRSTLYDFENSTNETDIAPWITLPTNKKYKALISQDFALSGTQSLRVFVDMQPYITNKDTEYVGVELTGVTPLQAKIITAWVFIPQSEPIQGINFSAHILAYVKDKNGVLGGFVGETKVVKPGTWTSLFIGTFGETTDVLGNLVWNGKIDILYLTVWSDKPYNGSIYIDDFSIYE